MRMINIDVHTNRFDIKSKISKIVGSRMTFKNESFGILRICECDFVMHFYHFHLL